MAEKPENILQLEGMLSPLVAALINVDPARVVVTIGLGEGQGSVPNILSIGATLDGQPVPPHVHEAMEESIRAALEVADLKRAVEAEGIAVVSTPDRKLN